MIPTQEFICRLARMDNSPCEKHGDVMHCKPLHGYVHRRAYQVTFEDGITLRYWLRAGVPVLI